MIATGRRPDWLAHLKPDSIDTLAGDLNLIEFQNLIENHIFDKYGKCDYLFNCAGTL